jgi:hypothetical protein
VLNLLAEDVVIRGYRLPWRNIASLAGRPPRFETLEGSHSNNELDHSNMIYFWVSPGYLIISGSVLQNKGIEECALSEMPRESLDLEDE